MALPYFMQLDGDSGDKQRQIEEAARKDKRDMSNALQRRQRPPPVSARQEIEIEVFDMDYPDAAPYRISE
jgi:hypothetical protein